MPEADRPGRMTVGAGSERPAGTLPLVSVIVNNYNYGRFLRESVDSALGQTYPNLEVIVVDDGSNDESRDILRSYGPRVRGVLKHNGGQASAFNAGLAISHGVFVAFLDSDDVYFVDKIEQCVRAATRHPSAAFIHHRIQIVDAAGTATGRLYPETVLHGCIAERVRCGGGTWQYAPTSGQLIRRDFLERIFPVPEDVYRTSADAYISCLAGLLESVAGIDNVLTKYRVHGANAWMSANQGDPDRVMRHRVERYEIECEALNDSLRRLGSPIRVSLSDNFAYQLYVYLTAQGSSLPRLLWLALRDSTERTTRGKLLAGTLAGALGVHRPRARRSTTDQSMIRRGHTT